MEMQLRTEMKDSKTDMTAIFFRFFCNISTNDFGSLCNYIIKINQGNEYIVEAMYREIVNLMALK